MVLVFRRSLRGIVPIPLTPLVRWCHFWESHVVLNEWERAMPTTKHTCKFIRDAVAILFECRILAGELVFTAAAFYGLYHALRMLIR
jgi:hypothetical protein